MSQRSQSPQRSELSHEDTLSNEEQHPARSLVTYRGEREDTYPAGSTHGLNFFSAMPREIFEKELLPWLSPPGVASLILAANLSVSHSVYPIIFINWKNIDGFRQEDAFTLALSSRDPQDEAVLADIAPHYKDVSNPSDDTYIHLAKSTEDVRLLTVGDVMMFISMYPDLNRVMYMAEHHAILGALRAGISPRVFLQVKPSELGYAYLTHFKDVPEAPFLRYVMSCVSEYPTDADKTISYESARTIIGHYYNHYGSVRSTVAVDILAKNKMIAYMPKSWAATPHKIYYHALSSGYIWMMLCSTNTNAIVLRGISDERWEAFVKDALLRVETEKQHAHAGHFRCFRGLVLQRRIPQILELCGRVRELIYNVDAWTAVCYRKVLGDEVFAMLTRPDMLRTYIISGLPYNPLGFVIQPINPIIYWCIMSDNAEYLRGALSEPFDVKSVDTAWHYRMCFKLGSVNCLIVLMEAGITVSATVLDALIAKHHTKQIINLFA